jgi:hypothetical protein
MAKDIESEDSKIEERESRTSQNLDSESKENMATARLKNAQAKKLEAEADTVDLDFIRKYDGIDREEHKEDKNTEWFAKSQENKLKLKHQRELEELKLLLKEKESQVNLEHDTAKTAINADKDLTIAQMKQAELNRKSLDAVANQKGDKNGLI